MRCRTKPPSVRRAARERKAAQQAESERLSREAEATTRAKQDAEQAAWVATAVKIAEARGAGAKPVAIRGIPLFIDGRPATEADFPPAALDPDEPLEVIYAPNPYVPGAVIGWVKLKNGFFSLPPEPEMSDGRRRARERQAEVNRGGGIMKIACVSDLHGMLPEIPECDLLLLGGDIGPGSERDLRFHARWYDETFRKWLGIIKVPTIAVSGNHDFIFQHGSDMVPDLPWTYLQDSGCEFQGLKIWGSPWQPVFGGWAFNATESQLAERWAMIPSDVDILLLHGPPRGYGDFSPYGNEHTGSPSLADRIRAVQPKLVVFGHIHSGYGEYRLGESRMLNASLVNESYEPVNTIRVVEVEPSDGKRQAVVAGEEREPRNG